MSTIEFVLQAQARTEHGTSASRRIRRAGRVPAIVYGGTEPPQPVSLDHAKLLRYEIEPAFFSHLLTLDVEGRQQQVVVRDYQRHPSKPKVLHVDLMRVNMAEELTTTVPLRFVGEDKSPGVQKSKGIVQHHLSELEISCLPANLPEVIEVDTSQMNLGDVIHLSDVRLPEGVSLVALAGASHLSEEEIASLDRTVVTIQAPAREETEEGAEGEADQGMGAADEE